MARAISGFTSERFLRPPRPAGVLLFLAALMTLSACRREDIAVYDAPKDAPAAPATPAHAHGSASPAVDPMGDMPPRPGLAWEKLPEGWTERGASGMRVANFSVAGSGGGQAELSVIPLPGTGGTDLDLVNLWRGQLGLAPITAAELASHTDESTVGGQAVKLFSIVGTGTGDASAAANQILVAALRRDGFTWFFKLAGDAPTVVSQREALKTFLGQVTFTAPAESAAAPAMAQASAGAPGGGGPSVPKWQVPDAWTAQKPGQMILQKWSVAGEGGAAADITVSAFPGDTGGLIPNLNRWRSQVGLSPAPEAELTALVDNLEVQGGRATLVDFAGSSPESGNPVRLVAAVVRRDGYSWFYKLLGAPAAVESQKESFVQFVRSAEYTRAF